MDHQEMLNLYFMFVAVLDNEATLRGLHPSPTALDAAVLLCSGDTVGLYRFCRSIDDVLLLQCVQLLQHANLRRDFTAKAFGARCSQSNDIPIPQQLLQYFQLSRLSCFDCY